MRRERGAALAEFAIVLPVFFGLILGLFTGGIAYNRKITLSNAAREGTRYGATLPVCNPNFCGLNNWLASVADIVQRNASGDLANGTAGLQICVAYVYPAGSAAGLTNDQTTMLVRTTGDAVGTPASPVSGFPSGTCFDDGRPSTERRVQVQVTRQSTLQALVFSWNLNLSSTSVTHFEAA